MSEAGPPTPPLARIRAALASRGVRPSRRYGQNFLTDPGLLQRIVEDAGVGPGDVVLEVGPGPGTLTATLLRAGARVVACEVDPVMIDLLDELLGAPPGLTVVETDVLAERPRLPAAVRAALEGENGERVYHLVSNLPYQVGTTLLVDLLWGETPPPRGVLVTLQLEVAERLRAGPRDAAYGAVSVLTQLRADVSLVRRLAAGAFWPRPNVESACVRLVPRVGQGAAPAGLHRVVRAAFSARRKSLANSLALGLGAERAGVIEALRDTPFAERRAEELAPADFPELAARLAPILPANGEAGGV